MTLFVFISFNTTPPKYHFRIAYVFIDVSLVFVLIVLLIFTEPLRVSLMNRMKKRGMIGIPTIK